MALIKCPECGKKFSEHAEFCPNCGYKWSKEHYETLKKEDHTSETSLNKSSNSSLLLGIILISVGFLWDIFILCTINTIFFNFASYAIFGLFIFGIAFLVVGIILLLKKYKKAKLIFIVTGILLIYGYISIFMTRDFGYYYDSDYTNEITDTVPLNEKGYNIAKQIDPSQKQSYFGIWEYTQPNNQDGVKSMKIIINPDETAQAHVNVNGNETIVYGSWRWIDKRISMHFNDTEEHINGLLYIDHLRVFTGYNNYFGIKYGELKYEDGAIYLYEDSSQAKAKNPNKRVKLNHLTDK